jgi:hypothetical protein
MILLHRLLGEIQGTSGSRSAIAANSIAVTVKNKSIVPPKGGPSAPLLYAIDGAGVYELEFALEGCGDRKSQRAGLFQFSAVDAQGATIPGGISGLPQSEKFGTYAYISADGKSPRFTVAENCTAVSVAVSGWEEPSFTVRLAPTLRLQSQPRHVEMAIARAAMAKLLQTVEEASKFVLIYTGTKKIGAGNRANRSMMFARALEKKGIPTLYTYSHSAGDQITGVESGCLLQLPLHIFSDLFLEFLSAVRAQQKVLIGSLPDAELCRAIDFAQFCGWTTLYECRDDWEEFAAAGSGKWFENIFEQYAVLHSHKTFCVSPALQRKMRQYTKEPGDVLLSPNGTTEHFIEISHPYRMARQAGSGSAGRRAPIVGYFGHLTDHWFDWVAVEAAAARLPELRFEVIGFDAPDRMVPRNIEYLGGKSHDELVQIAARWEVGLIPFKAGRLARSVDPIKIYEYLALGLKVVSTQMGVIDTFPMTFVYGEFELPQTLDKALAYAPSQRDWAEVDKLVSNSTWTARLAEMLGAVGMAI